MRVVHGVWIIYHKYWIFKVILKKCRVCNIDKSPDDFHLRSDTSKYRTSCRVCDKTYFSTRYSNKRDSIRELRRIKSKENPEPGRRRTREWKANNPEKVKINRKRYYAKNKERINKNASKRNVIYRKNNPDKVKRWRKNNAVKLNTRISSNLRSRLRAAVKNNQKNGSAVRDLGCSIESFKAYLECKFYRHSETNEEMTWENYGLKGWHIDHITPLSSFDITDATQIKKACHYTNLQPLWAKDNLRKSDKIIK